MSSCTVQHHMQFAGGVQHTRSRDHCVPHCSATHVLADKPVRLGRSSQVIRCSACRRRLTVSGMKCALCLDRVSKCGCTSTFGPWTQTTLGAGLGLLRLGLDVPQRSPTAATDACSPCHQLQGRPKEREPRSTGGGSSSSSGRGCAMFAASNMAFAPTSVSAAAADDLAPVAAAECAARAASAARPALHPASPATSSTAAFSCMV